MAFRKRNSKDDRAQDIVRQAEEDALWKHAPDILARMEADSVQDEADSFDPDDDPSNPDPDSQLGGGSSGGGSHLDSVFALESGDDSVDSSEESLTGTKHEPKAGRESTVDVSIHMDSESSNPSSQFDDTGDSHSGPLSDLPSLTKAPTVSLTPIYRPVRRPPMAVLRVYDDGMQAFDSVRIRLTPFDVGRRDGQIVVAHDPQMSGKHFRIKRLLVNEEWEWRLEDQQSMNGTFQRTSRLMLQDGAKLLIGGELIRFSHQTVDAVAHLIKVSHGEKEERVSLPPGQTHHIGSDENSCLPFLQGNNYLDPRNIRLSQDRTGRWWIHDEGATNFVWVRIESVKLASGDMFQAGEQRFEFHLP